MEDQLGKKILAIELCIPVDLPYEVARIEKALITLALEETGGNGAQAARLLGIERTNLYEKRKKYGFHCNPSYRHKINKECLN